MGGAALCSTEEHLTGCIKITVATLIACHEEHKPVVGGEVDYIP